MKSKSVHKTLTALKRVLGGQKRLLIVLHDNPDPDAMATAFALKYLTEEAFAIKATIAFGGLIERAENRAMVRELRIPLKRINRVRFDTYDRIALVDTQPDAANHSLPAHVDCHIVIDHHSRRRGRQSDFVVIDAGVGATATLLIEWLLVSELEISADLATALVYAIRSETQDLGREASKRDVQAYLTLYQRASIRKLARITHPKLPRSYFITLARVLRRTESFRNLICTHMGNVPYPEVVAEMADLLLKHQRIGWSLCTGRFKGWLYLSLRSANANARAGRVIRRLVPDKSAAGGHNTFAGGKVRLTDHTDEKINALEEKLTQDFAKAMGYETAEWRPLLPFDSTQDDAEVGT